MKGRKPKPTHLKIVQGNPGRRPLNPFEAVAPPELPEAPEFLTDRAKIEWCRVGPQLKEAGLLSALDRNAFAVYCLAVSTVAEASAHIAEHGAFITHPTGAVAVSPFVTRYNKAVEHILRFSAEFGLTPSSRSRIVATPEAIDDPLEVFLKHGSKKTPG